MQNSNILPRAESYGQSHVLSGDVQARTQSSHRKTGPAGFEAAATTTPGALLTANRHHLAKGANWHLDTAGNVQDTGYHPHAYKFLCKHARNGPAFPTSGSHLKNSILMPGTNTHICEVWIHP
jgi:hypothetical protein